MSALQEILEKGFVDPEVLMQLGEEQKQILFIKMREEQLRKWRVREAELEKQEQTEEMAQKTRLKNERKGVQWLCGKDGNVWVWVMGEHPDDLTIEQILDNESKEKARQLAEKEIMQTLRKADDLPIVLMNGNGKKRQEEMDELDSENKILRAELAQLELNGKVAKDLNEEQKPATYSPYDELINGNESHKINNNETNIAQDQELFNYKMENYVDARNSAENFQISPQETYDNLFSFPSDSEQSPSSSTTLLPSYTHTSGIIKASNSNNTQNRILNGTTNGKGNPINNQLMSPRAPPVPEKPVNLRRTINNSQNNQRFSGTRQFSFNTIRSYIPTDEMQKRQSKIFERLKEERERLEKEAELDARRQQQEYDEREQKAKEADESIRRIAQKAREQHRALLRTSEILLPLFRNNPNGVDSVRDALKALPRPPKPKCRQAIIKWFCNTELTHWRLTSANEMPSWFHGIITREEAERLLRGRPIGSFLLRVSERIFGYTLSYKSGEDIKNFLVERIIDGYQFMGANQLVHITLMELINHHKIHPITAKGGEVLREAVGQENHPPDYNELFEQQQQKIRN